jgi:hypothetical protein
MKSEKEIGDFMVGGEGTVELLPFTSTKASARAAPTCPDSLYRLQALWLLTIMALTRRKEKAMVAHRTNVPVDDSFP